VRSRARKRDLWRLLNADRNARRQQRKDIAWSRRAGFTLVEALVATLLMTVILGAIATVTGQWLSNWNRGFARLQRAELLAVGLDRLVADLAAAEIVSAGHANDIPVFDGMQSSVTFVRTTLGPNAFIGLEVVHIAETSDDRGPVLVRSTAPFAPMTADMRESRHFDFSNPVVMIRAPYQVSFSYAGPDRVWRDTWRGAAQLPRAIRVRVQDAVTGSLAVSTSTFIRAEVPARCAGAKTVVECLGTSGLASSR
jgi:general secretion pathway protein J